MTYTIDPFEYNISTRKVVVSGQTLYEARVKELPDICEFSDSLPEVYELVADTIETAASMFAEIDRPFPLPTVPKDDFSGRITLRVPKSLHRILSHIADDQGTSLNQYLVSALSYRAGVHRGMHYIVSHSPENAPYRLQIDQRAV